MDSENKTVTLDKTDSTVADAVAGLAPGDTLTVVSNDETSCVLEVQPAAPAEPEPDAADADENGEGEMPSAMSAMMKKKRTA